ncbi:ankyrin repeat-containing domain protein [Baffinella frigidus]|nr:ankyrin repeat-containing domain protein [Cryptophyta sp. CCMP2293]
MVKVMDGGETPLIVACASSHKDLAKMLLKKGADVHKNLCGVFDLAKMLFKKAADVHTVHGKGGTALIEAAGEGWNDVVADLLKKKADPNVQDENGFDALIIATAGDENGFDALMVAAAGGHVDVLTTLLKNKNKVGKPKAINKAKGTALHAG